jgi:hypothetical protein
VDFVHVQYAPVKKRGNKRASPSSHSSGNLRGLIDAANVVRFSRVFVVHLEHLRNDLEKAETRDEFRAVVIKNVEEVFEYSRSTYRRRQTSMSPPSVSGSTHKYSDYQ